MMRRLILTLSTVVCLGVSVGCQRPAALPEADKTAIRQLMDNAMKLTNANDWKGMAALYAADAVVLPPNQPAVQGRASIQAWLGTFPPISNAQVQTLEIEGQGDLAYWRGTVSQTLTARGAAPVESHDKGLTILRRQADGSWKVAVDVWNSDLLPPVPKKPATPAKKKKRR